MSQYKVGQILHEVHAGIVRRMSDLKRSMRVEGLAVTEERLDAAISKLQRGGNDARIDHLWLWVSPMHVQKYRCGTSVGQPYSVHSTLAELREEALRRLISLS